MNVVQSSPPRRGPEEYPQRPFSLACPLRPVSRLGIQRPFDATACPSDFFIKRRAGQRSIARQEELHGNALTGKRDVE